MIKYIIGVDQQRDFEVIGQMYRTRHLCRVVDVELGVSQVTSMARVLEFLLHQRPFIYTLSFRSLASRPNVAAQLDPV